MKQQANNANGFVVVQLDYDIMEHQASKQVYVCFPLHCSVWVSVGSPLEFGVLSPHRDRLDSNLGRYRWSGEPFKKTDPTLFSIILTDKTSYDIITGNEPDHFPPFPSSLWSFSAQHIHKQISTFSFCYVFSFCEWMAVSFLIDYIWTELWIVVMQDSDSPT